MGIIYEVEDSGFSGYIEDGEYLNARLLSVELTTKPFNDDKTGEPVKKFTFKFRVDSAEYPDKLIWGECGTRITNHPDNKFRTWAEAILGQRIPASYRGNTDDLLDRDCRIVVGKETKERNGVEKTRNFVREVHPTKEAAARLASESDEEPF